MFFAPDDSCLTSDAKSPRFNSGFLIIVSMSAALGGFLFGYDWVVIGGAKPFYEAYFGLNSQILIGWANSCALLGCLLGSILSGIMGDRLGRKRLLLLTALLFGISSTLTGWAESFDSFILWRIMGGVAIGIASNVSPTYIAEISPAPWRGRLVTMNQLTIVLGILAAQVVNLWIAGNIPEGASSAVLRSAWIGQWGWRWMFTAVALPSALLLLAALWLPESPRWLLLKQRTETARAILRRIGGEAYAQAETNRIAASLADATPGMNLRQALHGEGMPLLLLTGIGLAVLQQWCGINVIFNYAEEIYRGAGYSLNSVMFNIVITGVINLVFTLAATATVDAVGRRQLMLWGTFSLMIIHAALGFAYFVGLKGAVVLGLTLGAIATYAMTLAPVTWVLIAEIFPNHLRSIAVSIAVSALWIACFALTFSFPMLNHVLGSAGTFWIYAGICLIGFLFIHAKLQETGGLPLEEIGVNS